MRLARPKHPQDVVILFYRIARVLGSLRHKFVKQLRISQNGQTYWAQYITDAISSFRIKINHRHYKKLAEPWWSYHTILK